MAKTKIYVPDIECDSCVKVLEKAFSNDKNVKINNDSIEIDESEKPEKYIKKIKELGYRASLNFERKSFLERFNDFIENKHKYFLEYKLIKYFFGLFFILIFVNAIFVFAFKLPFVKYLQYFIYLNFSLAIIFSVLWHFLSYKTRITCMTGMMIGMTFGMQSGMMIGYIFGITNGFFTGSLVGMLIGFFVGFFTGKCCGIMGALQGSMSGIMAGTMGAMISVMLLNDNLNLFSPIYFILNGLIFLFLSYMIYEELAENKKYEIYNIDFLTLASYSAIALIIMLLIIYFGPKSVLAI
ncbi:MAG: heavy-metal-associated domain-containing protein [Candidatus Woesearchaeota archaeon]